MGVLNEDRPGQSPPFAVTVSGTLWEDWTEGALFIRACVQPASPVRLLTGRGDTLAPEQAGSNTPADRAEVSDASRERQSRAEIDRLASELAPDLACSRQCSGRRQICRTPC